MTSASPPISLAFICRIAIAVFGAMFLVATLKSQTSELVPLEFVKIPPGQFWMGCLTSDLLAVPSVIVGGAVNQCPVDELPRHLVRISRTLEMGKYEVTQAQWESVMRNNPSFFKGATRPVEQVSWDDVQQFLNRLNSRQNGYRYRLPTEAEWEYAARAGAAGPFGGPDLDGMAW